MTNPKMTGILDDLAAGRIDAVEAGRRIDALDDSAHEPSNDELAAVRPPQDDAWAAETDRPQRAGHPLDRVASPPAPVDEPVRTRPSRRTGSSE